MWLFNTLFNRSKANKRIFDFPSLKNRFPTKRAFCFSLSAVWFVCFLNLFFYYLFFYSFFSVLVCRLFGFRVHDYYKTVFRTAKLFEKKNLERSKNSLFANMERTRAKRIYKQLNINQIEKLIFFEKIFFLCKNQKSPVSMYV